MAVFLNGMSNAETAAMTVAMADSGLVMDWTTELPADARTVDKHSTGGVGDKISLVLAPLLASFGPRVPMMSGRGLGHTGGTLDKLEAIPGLTTSVGTAQVVRQMADPCTGFAIFAPTSEIAPVDKAIYALRDGPWQPLSCVPAPLQCGKVACCLRS